MGLPDYRTGKSSFSSYFYQQVAYLVTTVGEHDIINYSGMGQVVGGYLVARASSFGLTVGEIFKLYIDGALLFSYPTSEMMENKDYAGEAIIYPVRCDPKTRVVIAISNKISFSTSFRVTYTTATTNPLYLGRYIALGIY